MADKNLKCKGCSAEFVFTERDQEFYAEKGFSEPQSCPACRAKRKAERNSGGGNYNRDNFRR